MFEWFKKSSGKGQRPRNGSSSTPRGKGPFRRGNLPPRRVDQLPPERRVTDNAIAYVKTTSAKDTRPSSSHSLEDYPMIRPLGDGLCIAYIVDGKGSYRYVQQRHIGMEAISKEQLHHIGMQNLERLMNKRDLRIQPYQNIYAVLMGGDFEASLILIDQLWEKQFRQFVTGEYAIAIPNRDVLAFCDSTSAAGLTELQQLIERFYDQREYPISDRIYVRRNGRFVPHAA